MTAQRGSSLLEVVFAATLLTVVVFTLGILIPQTVVYTRDTGYDARACELAEQMIEEARALSTSIPAPAHFDGSIPNNPRHGFPPPPYPTYLETLETNGEPANMQYTFDVTTSRVGAVGPHTPPSGLIQMQVVINWTEGRGGNTWHRNFTLISYI
jgi:hypothetical protein